MYDRFFGSIKQNTTKTISKSLANIKQRNWFFIARTLATQLLKEHTQILRLLDCRYAAVTHIAASMQPQA